MNAHTPRPLRLCLPLCLLVPTANALAEITPELPLVTVTAEDIAQIDLDTTATVTRFDAQTLRTAAGAAASSPFQAVAAAPSVNFQSADPHGLTEVGFHETIKIRGVAQTGPASSRNIDALPITVNPGGSKGILDMENVAAIELYRGAAPVDQSLGFSNLPGKINLITRAPASELATEVQFEGGSDDFRRVFIRQDSGRYGILSGFLSGSFTSGHNWKGEGEFERQNVFAGLALDGGAAWGAELYAGYNHDERETYRFFNHTLASDFANYRRDWSSNPAKIDYYGYNRQTFTDRFVYANLHARLAEGVELAIKPYYLSESGDYWFSSINATDATKSRVIDWMIEHDNLGVLTRLDWQLSANQRLTPGLWLQRQEPPGPPSTQKKYRVTPTGLVFDGWQMLADNDPHRLISPFLSYLGTFDQLSIEAGLRYVDLRLGALTAYNASGAAAKLSDVEAARAVGGVDALASADAKTLTEWLPYLGLTWRLNPTTSLFTRIGRSYGLDVNLFPYYTAQRTQFAAKGVSFQSLWDRLELETADNLDLGLTYARDDWSLGLTGFYAQHANKQSTIYDPSIGVRYPWNVADAERYGLELEGRWRITPTWTLTGNYTWNRFSYLDDLALSASGAIGTKGKQVVDTPEHMLKLGLRYEQAAWGAGVEARYIGARYGDVLNAERVRSVIVVDASARYRLSQAFNLTLTVQNLFDEEYIGPVSAADDAIANYTAALNGVSGNGSSYQYGAPRTLYLGLSADF
ncbi:iron complex outermembrane recepter protein [Allochromatium warmingii]|uniref:Iron complex outermembrane recepter protein n=1 Tax=Allochromatium warmingii TaxID=61595 RepID=A0A1H3HSJ5_ALLWA|nr:TonB-dependent receptor [Allochromatium warmingii]SDY18437.1 iron complex outermembrane recepter protein [Allochromatium warmingii]